METQTQIPKPKSTPPILVIAAIAVVIFSATGTAAMMGWLPTSIAGTNENAAVATEPEQAAVNTSAAQVAEPEPEPAPVQVAAAPVEPVCEACGVVESIREIIRLAKRGCFVENMIQTAVPLKSSIALNGKEITVDLND